MVGGSKRHMRKSKSVFESPGYLIIRLSKMRRTTLDNFLNYVILKDIIGI